MSLLAGPAQVEEGGSLRLRLVREAIEPSFLELMQCDPTVGRPIFPKDHVQLGGVACRVEGCRKTSFEFAMAHGLCDPCDCHWQASGVPVEEFLATARRTWRYVGKDACCVRDCPRPCKSAKEPFCYAHLHQQRVSGLSIEDFVRRPGVVALPSFGICQVLACDREKDYERTPYCMAHRNPAQCRDARRTRGRRGDLAQDHEPGHDHRRDQPAGSAGAAGHKDHLRSVGADPVRGQDQGPLAAAAVRPGHAGAGRGRQRGGVSPSRGWDRLGLCRDNDSVPGRAVW
ncbi:hypothetical protein ACWC24_19200 [Streptomyces sp. NPDC001443]